jgi:hypothetical protein
MTVGNRVVPRSEWGIPLVTLGLDPRVYFEGSVVFAIFGLG